MYGDVTAIAGDNSSITITKEFPTEPVVTPETAVADAQSLQILADATNGTIFYDVDAKTRTVIKDFSSEGFGQSGNSCVWRLAIKRMARWSRRASGRAASSTMFG